MYTPFYLLLIIFLIVTTLVCDLVAFLLKDMRLQKHFSTEKTHSLMFPRNNIMKFTHREIKARIQIEIDHIQESMIRKLESRNVPEQGVLTMVKKFAWSRDLKTVKKILEAGPYENFDNMVREAFRVAVERGDEKLVKYLLSKGADVNGVNDLQNRPMVISLVKRRKFHVKCARILLQSGANVNITDGEGNSALLAAVENQRHHVTDMLLAWGADVNKSNAVGLTPLMMATKLQDLDCMKKLIAVGAGVNLSDRDRNTALHFAADDDGDDNCDILRTLLWSGSKINSKNKQGHNALTHHVSCDYRLLIARGIPREDVPFLLNTEAAMILFAAGESITDPAVPVPSTIIHIEKDLSLRNLCRNAVRKQLLKFDEHSNLLEKIPKLGMPGPMISYLTYDVS